MIDGLDAVLLDRLAHQVRVEHRPEHRDDERPLAAVRRLQQGFDLEIDLVERRFAALQQHQAPGPLAAGSGAPAPSRWSRPPPSPARTCPRCCARAASHRAGPARGPAGRRVPTGRRSLTVTRPAATSSIAGSVRTRTLSTSSWRSAACRSRRRALGIASSTSSTSKRCSRLATRSGANTREPADVLAAQRRLGVDEGDGRVVARRAQRVEQLHAGGAGPVDQHLPLRGRGRVATAPRPAPLRRLAAAWRLPQIKCRRQRSDRTGTPSAARCRRPDRCTSRAQ